MGPEIISACESFSMGKPEAAIPMMSEDVNWDMAGDQTVRGKAPLLKICEAMAIHSNPALEKINTIVGGNHIVVEGRSAGGANGEEEEGFRFCDIFRIEDNRIVAITSYVVLPGQE